MATSSPDKWDQGSSTGSQSTAIKDSITSQIRVKYLLDRKSSFGLVFLLAPGKIRPYHLNNILPGEVSASTLQPVRTGLAVIYRLMGGQART